MVFFFFWGVGGGGILICLQVPVDLVLVCNEKLLFGFSLVPCFLEFPGF